MKRAAPLAARGKSQFPVPVASVAKPVAVSKAGAVRPNRKGTLVTKMAGPKARPRPAKLSV